MEGEEPSKILYTRPWRTANFIKVGSDKTVDGKGEARKGAGKVVIFKEKEKVVNLTMKKEKKEGRINLLSHHQVST